MLSLQLFLSPFKQPPGSCRWFRVLSLFLVLADNTSAPQVWSKTCSLLDSFDIWDLSGRCVVARGDTVVVAGRPKIDIVSCLDHEGALPLAILLIYKFSLQVKLVVDGCSGVEPSSLSLECRNDSLTGEPTSVCKARL